MSTSLKVRSLNVALVKAVHGHAKFKNNARLCNLTGGLFLTC
jgi:hypothetical protein